MLDSIKRGYTPIPKTEFMFYQHDIKTWMTGLTEPLHNIIYPHCFKFYMVPDGQVRIKYKQWCEDPNWLPESQDAINVLKVRM